MLLFTHARTASARVPNFQQDHKSEGIETEWPVLIDKTVQKITCGPDLHIHWDLWVGWREVNVKLKASA